MIYSISNEYLQVELDSMGGELFSLKDDSGTEYLWQGNKKYWNGKAPVLFPYIARLTEDKYIWKGKEYKLEKHGFARRSEFSVEEKSDTKIVFRLDESAKTLESYPFAFTLRIIYELEGNVLINKYQVENKNTDSMYFGIGGHPGFNVPLEEGETFEDYYLEFDHIATPEQVGFTDACYVSGEMMPYELEGDKRLKLTHDLFDRDAIVLKNADSTVTLKSDKGSKGITVHYPDMDYIGFWHMPKTDAPYVCIEPWTSLPSRDGVVEDLEKQENLVKLKGSCTYTNVWSISVKK